MKVDVSGIGIFQECLEMVARIYNDKHTNEHTKSVIVFELNKLMPNHDILGYLNQDKFKGGCDG